MTEMTPKERELYDARADHEAWSHAQELLEPMLQITRLTASPELTRIMEKALAEVEEEVGRTLDVLEALVERREA